MLLYTRVYLHAFYCLLISFSILEIDFAEVGAFWSICGNKACFYIFSTVTEWRRPNHGEKFGKNRAMKVLYTWNLVKLNTLEVQTTCIVHFSKFRFSAGFWVKHSSPPLALTRLYTQFRGVQFLFRNIHDKPSRGVSQLPTVVLAKKL